MKTVTLDAYGGESQMAVVMETGEVVYETKVETTREALRRAVGGVVGPKRVIYEEGPLSGMIHDALKDIADEVISCDPTRNALIARAEDSSDERDARRLAGYPPDAPHHSPPPPKSRNATVDTGPAGATMAGRTRRSRWPGAISSCRSGTSAPTASS
jgi:hypothetical protein